MEIKKGNILSRTSYMEVLNTNNVETEVTNGSKRWNISNDILINESKSATWYNEEKFLSRSSICEILEQTNGAVFTVTFTKQVDEEEANVKMLKYIKKLTIARCKEDLSGLDSNEIVKDILKGEERTLIGYLIDTKQEFGRYKVIDLELQFKDSSKYNIRQVDSKTISELIFNGVKYKVKGK
jgi:hypothetical protein